MSGHGVDRQGWTIVTGAARGRGRVVARRLGSGGANVLTVDIDGAGLAEMGAQSRSDGWVLETVAVDVSDPGAVGDLFASLRVNRKMAVLVHCAGATWRGALLDMTLSEYRWIVETNLTGSFLLATGAARVLLEQGEGGSQRRSHPRALVMATETARGRPAAGGEA
jgi:NAD(P)-dependent dehydrogenase (short-subunit alcohol dehydrogenase family)